MRAMVLKGRTEGDWLKLQNVGTREPGTGEVLVRVAVCGVCRTDLHIVEGDLAPVRRDIVPGHEIVGIVERTGKGVNSVAAGDTVGMMWLHGTCGRCAYCLSGRENLCPEKEFTGYSVNGGYAEYAVGREDFLVPVPEGWKAERIAPLMCSGIIGYRALKMAMPEPGGRLGIFGFGGSAHITLQVASRMGLDVSVVTRSEEHLRLAKRLGAAETWRSGSDTPREIGGKLDSAIVFAPAGEVVKTALECVRSGGKVAVPAVHLDRLPEMDYNSHLFREKRLFSVEANTRADAAEFIEVAARLGIETEVELVRLEEANTALLRLKKGKINGAAVLQIT